MACSAILYTYMYNTFKSSTNQLQILAYLDIEPCVEVKKNLPFSLPLRRRGDGATVKRAKSQTHRELSNSRKRDICNFDFIYLGSLIGRISK